MDLNSREILGWLAGWTIRLAAAGIGAAVVFVGLLNMSASIETASGWAVSQDVIDRLDRYPPGSRRYVRLQVRSDPPPLALDATYLWRMGGRDLTRSVGTNRMGQTYMYAPAQLQGGPLRFEVYPNPYLGTAMPAYRSAAWYWPGRTALVLLDADMLLGERETPGHDKLWARYWRYQQVVKLAGARDFAYVYAGPLSRYHQVRSQLQPAPMGPVLPASDQWDQGADVEDVRQLLVYVTKSLGQTPVYVLDDEQRARQLAQAQVQVILLAPGAQLPEPGRVADSWDELLGMLASQ